ncbi:MAG: PfaD family polyunsaturated fatty acid/polyketide biosynthesis protein [Myxococcota bacterium]|nr:PfaD family polyunsaturated fatty acid/polyketide biosynthesis protein [Myxococcota bacterium]
MESLLEGLSVYRAQTTRVEAGGEVFSRSAKAGELVGAFQALGEGALVEALASSSEVDRIVLEDGQLSVVLSRGAGNAELTVRWATGEHYTETVLLSSPSRVQQSGDRPLFQPDLDSAIEDLSAAVADVTSGIYVVESPEGIRFFTRGHFGAGYPLVASIGPSGPMGPAWFRERLGTKANYVAGAMAGGIASPELVIAMGKAGYIGFYGSGGLPLPAVEEGIQRIKQELGEGIPAGFNLLHNPHEPAVESATVDLFLKYRCQMVSASAFMGLTPAVVRYRFTGAKRLATGECVVPHRLYAKVSRPEVARHFLAPASESLVNELMDAGKLSAEEGQIALEFPMADGITCEADSGGHTDHRPLPVILPVIRGLRDRVSRERGYDQRGIRVAIGAAGGLGCPSSIAGAFEMGAEYVLTGSVNQCTPEAGTSSLAKELLLKAGLADVASGAAPDMFEMGAHVQVLSRGTMYAKRSERLYDLYKRHASWEDVPEKERSRVEKQMLLRSFEEVWSETEGYWSERDPKQVERARTDGRHKMALVFRWYLGMSSRWARMGEASRKKDFQIWCGPAMGAFNDWVVGSSMEPLAGRPVVAVADALLFGTAVLQRARRLREQGVNLPLDVGEWRPD